MEDLSIDGRIILNWISKNTLRFFGLDSPGSG
jgi:hypothetical protein